MFLYVAKFHPSFLDIALKKNLSDERFWQKEQLYVKE